MDVLDRFAPVCNLHILLILNNYQNLFTFGHVLMLGLKQQQRVTRQLV